MGGKIPTRDGKKNRGKTLTFTIMPDGNLGRHYSASDMKEIRRASKLVEPILKRWAGALEKL